MSSSIVTVGVVGVTWPWRRWSVHSQSSRPTACLLVLMLVLVGLPQVEVQQTFIRDCNDATLAMHLPTNGHSYCEHTCNFLGGNPLVVANCDPAGHCTCPCDPNTPESTYATDVCPKPGDIPDPMAAQFMAACAVTCAGVCPGATGQICGEIPPTNNAKVCVCICPRTACPGTFTTTTIAPAPAQQTKVIIIPWPLLLKKFLWWLKLVTSLYYYYLVLALTVLLKYLYLKFVFLVLYEAFLLILNRLLRRMIRRLRPTIRQWQIAANQLTRIVG